MGPLRDNELPLKKVAYTAGCFSATCRSSPVSRSQVLVFRSTVEPVLPSRNSRIAAIVCMVDDWKDLQIAQQLTVFRWRPIKLMQPYSNHGFWTPCKSVCKFSSTFRTRSLCFKLLRVFSSASIGSESIAIIRIIISLDIYDGLIEDKQVKHQLSVHCWWPSRKSHSLSFPFEIVDLQMR